MTLTIAILAGGQSRRMGTDKAALFINGMTLLERTARLALAVSPSVLVVGRARPDGWPLPGVVFWEDAEPGLGPLGGLATALRHALPEASMLALACDLPLLTADALRWLIVRAQTQLAPSGLVTVSTHGLEPLFSVYRPECLPLIEARLAEGRRSLQGLIEAGEFVLDPAPEWVDVQLANVNTPEEWREKIENQSEEPEPLPPCFAGSLPC